MTIPFKQFSSFIQEVTLDGTPYRIALTWNTRGEYWTLIFRDRENNTLIAGIKLVLDYELIHNYPDRGLPRGHLYVIDTAGSFDRIGRYDFENVRKLSLLYVTEEEVESATIE